MNYIFVDSEYIDRVVFNISVQLERMLGRQVPRADLPCWLECVALDGGVHSDENETHVAIIHEKETTAFRNFAPADFEKELNGKAFKSYLGEFSVACYPVEEIVTKSELICEMIKLVGQDEKTERVMVTVNMDEYGNEIKDVVQHIAGKDVTILDMSPIMGRGFNQENLGFSVMAALGIKGSELK